MGYYTAKIIKKSGGWFFLVSDKGHTLFKTRNKEKAEKHLQGIKDRQALYKRK